VVDAGADSIGLALTAVRTVTTIRYCYEFQVASHARRRGVGSALMDALVRVVQSAGMTKVTPTRTNLSLRMFGCVLSPSSCFSIKSTLPDDVAASHAYHRTHTRIVCCSSHCSLVACS
jgi:GNAT superfamily N-acetyltransferase